jgi:hypothetical protein
MYIPVWVLVLFFSHRERRVYELRKIMPLNLCLEGSQQSGFLHGGLLMMVFDRGNGTRLYQDGDSQVFGML